jgi:hypothetical protein
MLASVGGEAARGRSKEEGRGARRRDPLEPLRGSAITVRDEGDDVVLAWPGSAESVVPAVIVLAITLLGAAALTALWARGSVHGFTPSFCALIAAGAALVLRDLLAARRRLLSIRLGPDALELTAVRDEGREEPLRAARADVGGARAERVNKDQYHLTVDVGLARHRVLLVAVSGDSAIGEPEVDWLARAIEAWAAEGRDRGA